MLKNGIKKAIMLLKAKKLVPIYRTVPDSRLLEGKVTLIIGGSGGIGAAIAKKCLEAGAKVIITGTNEQKLAKCCVQLGEGDRVRTMQFNILNVQGFARFIEDAGNAFEENRIDILINCAGTVNRGGFFDITEADYDRVMDTNTKGAFFLCQAVGRYMIEHKIKGHILNLSSSSALRPAWTPYQMSKWSVRGMTMGLADVLLPYGIIVNAIGPGQTATAMLGMTEGDSLYNPATVCGRYVTPDEVANLALFMVSGAGDLVVGETYYITGGSGTIDLHK